ncbi:hypothetical protein HYC85_003697 [Camellia sinensis]|uniref:Uncharacterized protein n=1 Tax=Camellia sinensis TaxID=4442 RepID=A0A7J7HUF0_CAMSI|nr:hypothetical protein HYC85_003697 [Camellia sinensis]
MEYDLVSMAIMLASSKGVEFSFGSTFKGGGAGMVLVSLGGTKVNLAYKLEFECFSNYEALISGLGCHAIREPLFYALKATKNLW